jgi:hypothetical protein
LKSRGQYFPNGDQRWCAIKVTELIIGDKLYIAPASLDVHISLLTMMTRNIKWDRQFQKAVKLISGLNCLRLCVLRNADVPEGSSPSVYHIKLHFGDWMVFQRLHQILASGGNQLGRARTLGDPKGPNFHVSLRDRATLESKSS